MEQKKSNISYYHFLRNRNNPNRQRLGIFAPVLGLLLIILFGIFFLPLFLYMLLFNRLYFWVRNQNSVPLRPYLDFNRHKIAHLGLMDRLWCEYCEWANGSLQWTFDIVNEIERRYCPIKSQCDPHCDKVKKWRKEFLEFDHTLGDLERFMFEGGYEKISVSEKKKEPSAG